MSEPSRLLRLPEVERLTGIRRTAIYERIGRNEFPQPLRISSRATVWRDGWFSPIDMAQMRDKCA